MKARSDEAQRWWIFDKPLSRDPLFITALVLPVLGYLGNLLQEDFSVLGRLIDIPVVFFSAVLLVGSTLGSVREYRRGKAEGRRHAGQPYN